MNILHLNTWDIEGGASRGAYWMHQSLLKAGVNSMMLVGNKSSDDYRVTGSQYITFSHKLRRDIGEYIDEWPLKKYKNKKKEIFSPAWYGQNILSQIQSMNPDIVNIHWIGKAFLNPETISKIKKPIVWTFRDMWGFTGGCHYTEDCTRYELNCGLCPHLQSGQENDLSRKLWQRKQKYLTPLNMTIVAVSDWLADCARQSSLFKNHRIETIYNAINTLNFKPRNKQWARELLNLPDDKKIILFGAMRATSDRRKGFQYLVPAIQKFAASDLASNTELIVFGASEPRNPPKLGMKTTYLGKIKDDLTLALVYAAADVMIVPSLQDACPKTPIESLACGTPVVCFDSSGLKEIVDHQKNGYRAKCFSIDDLAEGITWVLQDEQRSISLSQCAREQVEQKFTMDVLARAYIKLYQEILQNSDS